MKYILIFLIFILLSCSDKNKTEDPVTPTPEIFPDIFAADVSSLPMIEEKGIEYINRTGEAEDMIKTLKNNGFDYIRLRLWHTPDNGYSGVEEVEEFANRIKSNGLKVWLTVHYSDSWADPGKQNKPEAWQNLEFSALKDSIYNYTTMIMNRINPDIIQIGNEINAGILFPDGKISNSKDGFIDILAKASSAIREHDTITKIMIHYAGTNGASDFFSLVNNIDYDLIGISYYPAWHGKDLTNLKNSLVSLRSSFNRNVMIAETAYPFTLGWNDWTNNIIGLDEHLILPDYPATEVGQAKFMSDLITIVKNTNSITGLCYWGAELVAFDGPESETGSTWENMALYNFSNEALPVLEEFKNK